MATTTTNAPDPRSGHTAVWTGNEMIIWGSTGDTTGERYNPSTDSWTATSAINAPAPRGGHTAVWTDTEMIVWGRPRAPLGIPEPVAAMPLRIPKTGSRSPM